MDENQRTIIAATLAKAPDWVRHDLLSKDKILRQRAEETIATMIAVALANGGLEQGLGTSAKQVGPLST